MRKRVLLMSATLLAAGLTPLVAAGAAQAAVGTPGDIDKDGYRDVVVSAPDAAVGGHAKAGALVILYGTAQGVSGTRRTVLTQNSTGVPGAAESGDRFGASVVVHDLNADGYSDLVVGAPGEDVSGDDGGGSVTVVYGTASGPVKGRDVADPWPYSHDAWGRTLAVGTYNGLNPVNDGKLSIAVGANDAEVTYMPADLSAQSGTSGNSHDFNPAHGILALTAVDLPNTDADHLLVHGRGVSDGGWGYDGHGDDPHTVLHDPAGFDHHTLPPGTTSAVGDLNGNGALDIVIGNPEDPAQSPGSSLGGHVTVYFDAAHGSPSSTRTITQDTPGVPGAGEAGDRFGASVAIGDTDKDGKADLVIGAPGENGKAGAVTAVRGTASGGLDTAHARVWTQNTTGVPGGAEAGDAFGSALRLVDTNKDGYADLLIGAPGEDSGAGGLWALRGSAGSLTATGAKSVTTGAVGLGSAGAARLGAVVTTR